MAVKATAARRADFSPERKVIVLSSKEAMAYSNILSIIDRPSVHKLETSATDLLQDVMQVTYDYSRYPVSDTSKAVLDAVLGWERRQAAASSGINLNFYTYNRFVASLTSKREDSSHKELLQRMLPLSYAIWAAAYLVAASVFWTMFAYGLASGAFVIGPWLNLMLCVASTGLLATVVTAIIEWRRKHSERQPEK